MARRLRAADLFEGVTTLEERRERIRARILERGVADEVAGVSRGSPETWRALWERVFGESFDEDLF